MEFHVDGTLVDAADATLPVADRGVAFGDAITESLRVAGGTPVAWSAHADRLRDACAALDFGAVPSASTRRSPRTTTTTRWSS